MGISMTAKHTGFAWRWLPLLLAAASAASAADQALIDPAPSTELMPLAASRSLVLDFAESDSRAIAVGERGHVLLSESRSDWRQTGEVPTRATLTAVAAVGENVWAVGHDGTILHSSDGGVRWSEQRRDVWTPAGPDEDPFSRDPRLGAPLLDVLFTDAENGFAVGAYALALRTSDGGATWERMAVAAPLPEEAPVADDAAADEQSWTFDQDELALEAVPDPHLNGIARSSDGTLVIVAERGTAFRSTDDGQNWQRIELPYDGSMFGVVATGEHGFVAFGLRGNVLESRDGAATWQVLETDTEASLMGGAALPDGGVVIVGANGVVLHRADGEAPIARAVFENENHETPVLAGVLPLGPRTFLVGGERGIGRFELK